MSRQRIHIRDSELVWCLHFTLTSLMPVTAIRPSFLMLNITDKSTGRLKQSAQFYFAGSQVTIIHFSPESHLAASQMIRYSLGLRNIHSAVVLKSVYKCPSQIICKQSKSGIVSPTQLSCQHEHLSQTDSSIWVPETLNINFHRHYFCGSAPLQTFSCSLSVTNQEQKSAD